MCVMNRFEQVVVGVVVVSMIDEVHSILSHCKMSMLAVEYYVSS